MIIRKYGRGPMKHYVNTELQKLFGRHHKLTDEVGVWFFCLWVLAFVANHYFPDIEIIYIVLTGVAIWVIVSLFLRRRIRHLAEMELPNNEARVKEHFLGWAKKVEGGDGSSTLYEGKTSDILFVEYEKTIAFDYACEGHTYNLYACTPKNNFYRLWYYFDSSFKFINCGFEVIPADYMRKYLVNRSRDDLIERFGFNTPI
jgi:hypothetical protein